MNFENLNTNTQKLPAMQCRDCSYISIEKIFLCPECSNENFISVNLAGTGKIYTYTVVQVGFGHMAEKAPYLLAIVETDEKIKLTTVIEGEIEFDKITIGMNVIFKRHDEIIGPVFALA